MMQNTNKPVLSISILVSNRIDTIRKCMDSIRPLLTQIPCELVAVDTVGEATDGSIDIVREYTDNIYRFEWCNDFAAARNFGLGKCTGEWFMFLDDDEWFEDVSEIVTFFQQGEYKKYQCATYKIHTYSNREGAYSVATLFRMIKLDEKTEFIGKIHEYLSPLYGPTKEFSSYIHHYGYVFDTEEEHRKHSERNLSLLRPEFEKDPWNMHTRVQLVQECMFLDSLQAEAEKLCAETLQAEKKYYLMREFQWILTAYVRLANKNSDYEEVLKRAETVRKKFPLSAISDLAISTMELNACYRLKQYEKGVALLKNALEKREFLMNNPEKKQHMLTLDFETFLDDDIFCEILRSGICCCRNTGRQAWAEELTGERFKRLRYPVLSVSVLVSNRIDTVRKCLESIQTLLTKVPSELIIVDTVGETNSDGSLAVAKEYTEHIVPFTWCDDFSAARNAGLMAASGEWFLYLDDDEWFENTEEIQRFFISGEYLDYNSATYLARNYKDKGGAAYREDILGRMVRRGKNTEFVGCVNETFRNLYLPHKSLADYVHHYGFVYDNAEEKKAHMQYVYRLLQKDMIEHPDNLRNRAQLTAVLSLENPAEALRICKDTLTLCQDKKDSSQYQWQAAMLFSIMETLKIEGTEAEEWYQRLKQEKLMSCAAELAACYRLTRIWILHEEYGKAYPYAKTYFDLTEYCSQNPEEVLTPEFQKYQTAEYMEEMLTLGAFCAWKAGEYATAWKYYETLSWENMDASAEDSLWKIFAMAEEAVDKDALFRIMKRVMKNDTLKQILGRMMQNPTVKGRVNDTMATQRLKAASLQSVKGEEKEQELVQEQEETLESLPLEEFKLKIAVMYSCQDMLQNKISWNETLDRLKQTSPVKYSYLLYCLAAAELQKAVNSGAQVGELMEYYVLTGRTYYEALYRPECFAKDVISWLPEEVRYNDILYRFITGGKREMRTLLDAAKLRPEMAQVIKKWVGELAQK
ncbi:MAG: glycosyltransferase [Lachnospiraceae bacterium]